MGKVLVIGSLNMDQVTRVKVTPKVGETILANGLDLIPGGKGANQAVAMGKLGADVAMIGVVGKDANGEMLLSNLHANNVINQVIELEDISTGSAWIMLNESGDNSIVVIPGANGQLKPEDVKEEWFEGVDYLVCQLETPVDTIETAMKMAKGMGVKTVLNPAPARQLSDELLSAVDLMIPNETEFESLTGISVESKKDLVEGFEKLNVLGISELIVTLGAKGAWYYNGDEFLEVSGKKVDAIDTTAAGDSFIGGVVKSLAEGESMKDALAFATKVAAITVTRFGAQSSLPSKEEVEGFQI